MLTPDKTIQGVLSKTVLPFCLIAIAAVAAVVEKDEAGSVREASIVLGGVAPVALKRTEAEAFLKGKTLDDGTVQEAAELCLKGSVPLSCNEYKIDVTKTLVKRALRGE